MEIVSSVRRAYDDRDWPRLVGLVGLHWSLLFDEEHELLDELLRDVPLDAFQSDARAAAVRDIRLHASSDAVDRMLGSFTLPNPDDLETLESIARSDRALQLLSVTATRMIAFRVRGLTQPAIKLAKVLERLGRLAAVHRPALIQPRLPSLLLQVGITRGLADDLVGAVVVLRDAHERAPMSRAQHVARDAASKLALFFTLSGDIERAQHWLACYEVEPIVQGWHRPRVALTADVARCLAAIEALDREQAELALKTLTQPVNSEQSWGPAVTYAVARHALAWGDRLGALDTLRTDRERYADWLGPGSTFGPLLAQAESDLRLSLGQPHQARLALGEHADHPLGRVAEARVTLVAGKPKLAARLAAVVVAESHSIRARVDALGVQVIAHLRLGERPVAAAAHEHLNAAVRAKGVRLIGHLVNDEARRTMGGDPRSDSHGAWESIPPEAETVQLTEQQQLVLSGLGRGKDFKEIAAAAHLSYNTVKTHARALYRRLGASSRDEAIARAYDAGLL